LAGVLSGASSKEQVMHPLCVGSQKSTGESGAAHSARGFGGLGYCCVLSTWDWDLGVDPQFSALIQWLCDAGTVE